jgi:hypothetical protein
VMAPVPHLRRVALTEILKDTLRQLLQWANTPTDDRSKYLHQPKATH